MRTAMAVAICVLAAAAVTAGEFRGLKPIRKPKSGAGAREQALQAGPAVSRSVVEGAVRDLAKAWNTTRLPEFLGSDFYDASRLGDAMESEVPRDARLTVLGMENAETLGHFRSEGPGGESRIVSRVQVTVRTQVEFDDPTRGHVRLEGTNQLVLDITRAARRGSGR